MQNDKIGESDMTAGVRLHDDDHTWLMDHRDSKKKGVADVVHELIEFWGQHQNDRVKE